MRPNSTEILEIANKNIVEIDCMCEFGELVDGYWEDTITYREEIISLKITDSQNDVSKGLRLGSTVCARLDLVIFDVEVKANDRIKPYIRFKKSDGTYTSWVGLGYFYVRTCSEEEKIYTITAFDRMTQLDKRYKSNLSYPAKMSDMLAEMVEREAFNLADGVTCDSSLYVAKKPQDVTYRDVIGYIASANGGSAKFNRYNKLYFTTFDNTETIIDAKNCISMSRQETPYTVDYVNIKSVDNTSYIRESDEKTDGVIEFYNPWATSDMAAKVTAKLHGLTYYGCELVCQGTGIYEIGDRVSVKMVDGTEIPIIVTSITRTISNGAFTEAITSSASTANEQAEDYIYDTTDKKASNANEKLIGPIEEFSANEDGSYNLNNTNYTFTVDENGYINHIEDSNGALFDSLNENVNVNTGKVDYNTLIMSIVMMGGLPKPSGLILFNHDIAESYKIDGFDWSNTAAGEGNPSGGDKNPTAYKDGKITEWNAFVTDLDGNYIKFYEKRAEGIYVYSRSSTTPAMVHIPIKPVKGYSKVKITFNITYYNWSKRDYSKFGCYLAKYVEGEGIDTLQYIAPNYTNDSIGTGKTYIVEWPYLNSETEYDVLTIRYSSVGGTITRIQFEK